MISAAGPARSEINDGVSSAKDGEFEPIDLGPISVWPPVILAPMAGVTDIPFRTLCRDFSAGDLTLRPEPLQRAKTHSPGVFVNQMITARAFVEGHAKTLKLAEFGPNEKLRSIQLYGTEEVYLAKAVEQLVEAGHVDHIDMNFGCPVPKVTRHGGGAALPYHRPLFQRIVRAAVKAADGQVPVTVKFRMGIDDDHLTYLDTGRIAEDEGCSAVALHARTAHQLYSGHAQWDAIAKLKEAVTSIPVLGNGDIWEAPDALRMMRETGADGVVIGRGCLGRPWLFDDLAAVFDGHQVGPLPTLESVAQTMRQHAGRLVEWRGSEDSLRSFRKHAAWYFTGFPVGRQVRRDLMQVSTLEQLETVLARIRHHEVLPIEALRIPRSHKGGPKPVALPEGWLDNPMATDALPAEAEAMVSGG